MGRPWPDNADMTKPAKPELVSQTAFMRRTGLGRSRLQRLIAEGLPQRDGKIEAEKALAWIEANTDPRRKDNWQGDVSLNDLRREREQIRIEEGRLDLARARGELIERAVVRKFISERARMERDRWLSWASAVSARLASSLGADHGKLFAAIEGEVRDHLRQLAGEKLVEEPSTERHRRVT
jgi:hypothetical protein